MTALRDRLSPFKCPKRIVFVEAMPKTATGKIRKGELRKHLSDTYGG